VSGGAIPERLDKILANNGFGTRSEVRRLIRSGAVACGGVIIKEFDKKIIASAVSIEVGGRALHYNKYIYLMMNKPKGVISASFDPKRRTVADLLPEQYHSRKPFPAGRLDKDTTGLLLLTDDGDLAHRLLSPKMHVEKEYIAVLDRMPDDEVAEGFGRGAELGGGVRLRPAKLLTYTDSAGEFQHNPPGGVVRVILTEGKYHQIKRMFGAYGIAVTELKRIRMGGLMLDQGLAPGKSRELSGTELALLTDSQLLKYL